MIEVEMKLVATDAASLAELPQALRSICDSVRRLGRHTINDRYYDTESWAFHRANFALRVRRTKGKTVLAMKSLDRPRAGVSHREELEQELPAGLRGVNKLPKGRVADNVKKIAGGEDLRELFRIRNRRTVYECDFGDLTALASADDFEVRAGGREETLAEVEIEISSGGVDSLQKLGRLLARRLHLSRAFRSKYKQGLDLAGLKPPKA